MGTMEVWMYRRLEVWQDAIKLIKSIYILVDILPKSEDFNLKSQLKRAVVSVALNIAEGKCRSTAKEFAHFLNISSSSLSEVEAIINICTELEYIKEDKEICNQIKILNKRINALRNKLLKGEN